MDIEDLQVGAPGLRYNMERKVTEHGLPKTIQQPRPATVMATIGEYNPDTIILVQILDGDDFIGEEEEKLYSTPERVGSVIHVILRNPMPGLLSFAY